MTGSSPFSFPEAVDGFLQERRLLGYSKSHLFKTRQTLGVLQGILQSRQSPLDVRAVTHEDLVACLESERRRGLSDGTLHISTCVYRRFFRWLFGKGSILLDPAQGLVGPRVRPHIGYVPSVSEVRRLLAAAGGGSPEDLREGAILELLYGSGLRISEVRNLDVTDIDLSERTLLVRAGKGKKDRAVPMTHTAAEAIARYLAHGRPGSSARALFLSSVTGGRLSIGSWSRAYYHQLLTRAGLSHDLTSHRLRHACAVHLLARGAGVRLIQRLLGHASIQTTEVYLALDAASLHEVLRRAHPRERERRNESTAESES